MATFNIFGTNPQYTAMLPRWRLVECCYAGAEAVKYGPDSDIFLPIQRNEAKEMLAVADKTKSQYALRKRLATYENFFKPTVDDIVGIMQKNPPRVRFGVENNSESPPEVCDIEFFGNQYNDGLKGLKWRLNFNQVLYGRYGLLLDIRTDNEGLQPRFCISEYPAIKILDGEIHADSRSGSESLRWVLLDESTLKFDRMDKNWRVFPQLRILGLNAMGRYYQSVLSGDSCVTDWTNFDFDLPKPELTIYPVFKQKALNFIPFTVCNVNRLGITEWQDPPYADVAQVAISNYQVDSVYKRALSNHASPTLVVSNAQPTDKDLFLGDVIQLKSSANQKADASILETSGAGLAEMRAAKESLKASLKYSSIRDLLDGAGASSSGEAIQLRTASGTAVIASIDNAGSRAIEEQLVFAAQWAGATQADAGKRIGYDADTSYLSSDFQLQSVVNLLKENFATQTLSNQNLYAVLEKTLPGVLSSFEDNEVQKVTETEGTL